MRADEHPAYAEHRALVVAAVEAFNKCPPPMADPLIIAAEQDDGGIDIIACTFRDAARHYGSDPVFLDAINRAARRRDESPVPVLASVMLINRAGMAAVTAIVGDG